jgi:hypothetical protein
VRVSSQREPEAKLLKAFERIYLNEVLKSGICFFDLDLPGYGIPDLIWISWQPASKTKDAIALSYESVQKRLRERRLSAFELKISHWKKALLQAQRYRYFADRSFVVLPLAIAAKAKCHLAAFRNSRVGLWGVDCNKNKLVKYYTPTGTRPLNSEAKKKVAVRILKVLKLSKLAKRTNTAHQII